MLRLGSRVIRSLNDPFRRRPSWPPAIENLVWFRTFASRGKLDQPEQQQQKPIIKWFNQLLPGSSQKEEINAEEEVENSPEARALRAKIDQLDAESKEMSGANKPTLIEPLIATLTPEDQVKVRKALAEEKEEEDDIYEDDVSLMDLPKLENLGPKLGIGPEQTAYLRRLDKSLRNAADDVTNPPARSLLWRTYIACKRNLPPFLRLLPNSIFRVLWESQLTNEGRYRASYLCELAQDTIDSGRELSQQQALFYIDALLRADRLDDAHDRWQKEGHRLESHESTRLEYLYLGARIFSIRDAPEKAQEIAMSLLPVDKDMVSSLLTPVIISWIKRGDDLGFKSAWALYLRLRTDLGAKMSITDFDNISLTLLKSGRTDMALAVFKDLMLSNDDSPATSAELYKASLGLVGKLHGHSFDPAYLNQVSLTALIAMPKRFQNKFFYGSWMKHLIGKGEVDAAAAVVELMLERGLRPDAKHMNGVIGAWLRRSSHLNQIKAERMAWAMIAQRLRYVRKRRGQSPSLLEQEEDLRSTRWPRHIQRYVPMATIETFSILLLSLDRRHRKNKLEVLGKCFAESELKPNLYYINHLMRAELYLENHRRPWDIFQSIPPYIAPDLETFGCLWDTQQSHLARRASDIDDRPPGPREMFRTMISWYCNLSEVARETTRKEFSGSFYAQVIRCMCLSSDIEGTVIAMYVLKDLFNVQPKRSIAQMITLQLAQIVTAATWVPARSRRGRYIPSASARGGPNITRMTQLLDLVFKERIEVIRQRGIDPERLEDDEKDREVLIVLTTYLRIMHQRVSAQDDFEEKLQAAADEMGAPDITNVVKTLVA